MNINLELLKNHICGMIKSQLTDFEIDADEIANSTAIKALSEIQAILFNEEYSDFEIVDEIVEVFIRYGLDFGYQHEYC